MAVRWGRRVGMVVAEGKAGERLPGMDGGEAVEESAE